MLTETLALFKIWSQEAIIPWKCDRAMHNLFKANCKLVNRVLTVNVLKDLLRKSVGRNQVMYCVRSLTKSSRNDLFGLFGL